MIGRPYGILFVTLLFLSCMGKKSVVTESSALMQEQDFFVFDLTIGIREFWDTILFNDLLSDISYIPLETGHDFMLPSFGYRIAKIDDNIYISSGGGNQTSSIFRFGPSGKFIAQLIHYGRGPGEVPMLVTWYANVDTKRINIVGSGSKMVIAEVESEAKTDVWIDEKRGLSLVPLRDSTFVSAQWLFYKEIPPTYLYFTNMSGDLIHSIERNDDKVNYNWADIKEGLWEGPYEQYRLVPDNIGGAIFHDIFNDTLYRVKSRSEITPHLVIKRGALAPRPEDTHKLENKKKQVYFTGVRECGDYVFLNYHYGGVVFCDVWSKRDGRLLIHIDPKKFGSVFDSFVPFRLPDGSVVELPIVYTDENNAYGVLEAMDACKFMPNVKEDDNPVIVIARLKK